MNSVSSLRGPTEWHSNSQVVLVKFLLPEQAFLKNEGVMMGSLVSGAAGKRFLKS